MRSLLLILCLFAAGTALSACGLTSKPADPYALLPPGDRPAPGPGLFSGESGSYQITVD